MRGFTVLNTAVEELSKIRENYLVGREVLHRKLKRSLKQAHLPGLLLPPKARNRADVTLRHQTKRHGVARAFFVGSRTLLHHDLFCLPGDGVLHFVEITLDQV